MFKNTEKWRKSINSKKESKRRKQLMRDINLHYRTTRICKYCNKEFSARLRRYYCDDCVITNKLMQKYGITELEYNDMLARSNGLCELCLKRSVSVIDHDHETKKVRGLLCRSCNYALSFFDDKELHSKMYIYANKFRQT